MREQVAPQRRQLDGALELEVEGDEYRRAFRFQLAVLRVDDLLVQREALVPDFRDPRPDGDRLVHADLACVGRVRGDDNQSLGFPVGLHVEHLGEKLVLAEVEVVLLVDVVDMPQHVDIRKAHLDRGFGYHWLTV